MLPQRETNADNVFVIYMQFPVYVQSLSNKTVTNDIQVNAKFSLRFVPTVDLFREPTIEFEQSHNSMLDFYSDGIHTESFSVLQTPTGMNTLSEVSLAGDFIPSVEGKSVPWFDLVSTPCSNAQIQVKLTSNIQHLRSPIYGRNLLCLFTLIHILHPRVRY